MPDLSYSSDMLSFSDYGYLAQQLYMRYQSTVNWSKM